MYDTLLKRYGNISFIDDLEGNTFIDFIYTAMSKELEDRLWEKWLVDYGRMSESDFISFEEYKAKHFQEIESKTDEEVLEDAENILKMLSR